MSSSLAACGKVLMFGDTKEHETMQTGRSNHILTPYSPPPRDLFSLLLLSSLPYTFKNKYLPAVLSTVYLMEFYITCFVVFLL